MLLQQARGLRRAPAPGLSRTQMEVEGPDICLCRDTQLKAGDAGGCAGAGGDAQLAGAHPSPSTDPKNPELCSQRRDAGGWSLLPWHRLYLQPGLSACRAWFGAGKELVVAACLSLCVPWFLAASALPWHQAQLGTD